MSSWTSWSAACLVLALMSAGCAPAGPAPTTRQLAGEQSTGPTRATAAIMEDLTALNSDVSRAITITSTAGSAEVERLLNAGLVVVGGDGRPLPELAEAVPSLENGQWKLFPDGRMETSYRIRANARWHDGTPFTSEDVAFSATVLRDRELGVFRNVAFDSLETVEAPDLSSLVVRWRQPFIDADKLFVAGSLIPEHLLQRAYLEDKANLLLLPFWSEGYIGTGAYKLREWARGSHLVLEAFEGYVLGRPKIDVIEVRILEDRNTLIANVLSGEVDFSLGRGLSLEQAMLVRDRWTNGRAVISLTSWISIYPQFIDTHPPVITDVRFRKALMHAIDRQQMVDTLQYGLTQVAHNMLSPDDPDYEATKDVVVRYEYDPRTAVQLIESIGLTRGADGRFRNLANQRLGVEYRTMDGYDIHLKTIFPVAEFWQSIGIDVDTVVFPQARAREREWVSTFPGFLMYRQPNTLASLRSRHSRNTPVPENRFVGQNYARYRNPELDALIDKYFLTIPRTERIEVARLLLHYVSDQLPMMGLYYDTQPVLVSNRIQNMSPRGGTDTNQAWNAHEWTVKG